MILILNFNNDYNPYLVDAILLISMCFDVY